MKRIVMVSRSVMALITCVFYSKRVKERDKSIRTILLWGNPTPYKIPIEMFRSYFDGVYAIPPELGGWMVPSLKSLKRDWGYYRFLNSSGLTKILKEPCEREILLTDVDNNGLLHNVMRMIKHKKNPHEIILFEEGLALYNKNRRTLKEITEYNLGKKKAYPVIIGQSNAVDAIVAQWPKKLPGWKRKDRNIVRQSDVFSDRELLSEMVLKDKQLQQLRDAVEGKKIVLYLGFPCIEQDRSFRMVKEIKFMDDLIDLLPDDYMLLIKGHPREPINKYKKYEGHAKCIMFNRSITWYPIEYLLPLFQIKAAVTCASSSAINIAERVQGCRTVYTYKYMGVNIPEAWITMFDNPQKGIYTPKTKEELQRVITLDVPQMGKLKKKDAGDDINYMMNYLKGKA